MTVKEAVVARFMEILRERNMRPNELANLSGITPSTVYSMLDRRRKELSINVIKKLCDGLDKRSIVSFVIIRSDKMFGFGKISQPELAKRIVALAGEASEQFHDYLKEDSVIYSKCITQIPIKNTGAIFNLCFQYFNPKYIYILQHAYQA